MSSWDARISPTRSTKYSHSTLSRGTGIKTGCAALYRHGIDSVLATSPSEDPDRNFPLLGSASLASDMLPSQTRPQIVLPTFLLIDRNVLTS